MAVYDITRPQRLPASPNRKGRSMTLDVDRLIELAGRCESASGPDRELDYDIGRALGWRSVERVYLDGARTRLGWKMPDGTPLEVGSPPYYTASLDAAMTLVPDGWNWMAGNRDQPKARAYVNNGELAFSGAGQRRNPKQRWFEVVATSPALALCAAAIRAMSAAEQKDASL